jgi:anti-sigma regulatory factor (Ser/Thr protein kinase)
MAKINPNLKKIVMTTIQNYDDDSELLIGGYGMFNKKQLLEEINNETEIGKEVALSQEKFIQDLVNGKIYQLINQ